MSWDKKVAVNYAKSHASSHSQGRCAEYTRKAVQAGGVTLGRTYHAKDYGPMLKNAGFSAIGALEEPREGDVIIIQPYANGNPSGHMTVMTGIPTSNSETCGPVRVIGPQSRHTPFTGRSNESLSTDCSHPADLWLYPFSP